MKKKVIISAVVIVVGYLVFLFFRPATEPVQETPQTAVSVDSSTIAKDTIHTIYDSIKK